MLPEFLVGSYTRYKADTSIFTTWLSQAAIACGWKFPEESSAPALSGSSTAANGSNNGPSIRKKGKARKEGMKDGASNSTNFGPSSPQSGTKYTITTKDLLDQANAVAGRFEIPPTLRIVLERAIHARQRCAEWFQASKVQNQYSNEGHRHFIEILEQTLNILETRKAASAGKKASDVLTNADEENANAFLREITNRFQALEIEDSVDSDDFEAAMGGNDVFELQEESVEMKMSLMIFCFFEDLHRIQDFLHGVWKIYKAAELDLITASVITNSSFDLVRRNEEEILATAPHLFSNKRSYATIAIVIFYADALSQGQNPEEKLKSNESLRITPFDDFIFLSTARILMKYEFLSTVPNGVKYPAPSMPLRFNYISRPDLLGNPYMDKKEKEDELLSQYIIDHGLYMDLIKAAKMMPFGESSPPIEDELSKGLRALREQGIISVWAVFAARIFLDIQDILGQDVKRSHRELKRAGVGANKVLESTGAFRAAGGVCWLTKDSDRVAKLQQFCSFWVIRNPLPDMKKGEIGEMRPDWGRIVRDGSGADSSTAGGIQSRQLQPESLSSNATQKYAKDSVDVAKQVDMRGVNFPEKPKFLSTSTSIMNVKEGIPAGWNGDMETLPPTIRDRLHADLREKSGVSDEPPSQEHIENAKRLNLRLIRPNANMGFFFTHNPLYCGMAMLEVAVNIEACGITLCNYHSVVTLVAHLYNTASVAGLLENRKWPEMGQIIDMHIADMFAGQLPQSVKEAYIRYGKAMGLSVGSSLRRSHPWYGHGFKWTEGKERGPQYKHLAVADVFRPYFDRKGTFDSCVTQLEPLLLASQQLDTKHKRRNARRKLTPLQFLMQLKEFLPSEIPKLQFDYITLTQRCHMLLNQIRLEIQRSLQVEHPLLVHSDSTQPMYAIMVMKILREANEMAGTERQGRDSPPQSPQLEVVGSVLKKYLDIRMRVSSVASAS